MAVVNQTIAGLAQGRKIKGKVMFLGGPLYYNQGLRKAFRETLKLEDNNALFPEYSLYAVALGASIFAEKSEKTYEYGKLIEMMEDAVAQRREVAHMSALFENDEELKEFKERHGKETVEFKDIAAYSGDAYLGIDCGSTTTKLVLINDQKEILWHYYNSNKGNPVDVVKEKLSPHTLRRKNQNPRIGCYRIRRTAYIKRIPCGQRFG